MAQSPAAREPVLSPCIGVCRLGGDGLCEGCRRTTDEIARWLEFSNEQRLQLMNEVLPHRASRPQA